MFHSGCFRAILAVILVLAFWAVEESRAQTGTPGGAFVQQAVAVDAMTGSTKKTTTASGGSKSSSSGAKYSSGSLVAPKERESYYVVFGADGQATVEKLALKDKQAREKKLQEDRQAFLKTWAEYSKKWTEAMPGKKFPFSLPAAPRLQPLSMAPTDAGEQDKVQKKYQASLEKYSLCQVTLPDGSERIEILRADAGGVRFQELVSQYVDAVAAYAAKAKPGDAANAAKAPTPPKIVSLRQGFTSKDAAQKAVEALQSKQPDAAKTAK